MCKRIFIFLFVTMSLLPNCFADETKTPESPNTFNFYIENDVLNNTDAQYTSGFKFTWISKNLNSYRETDSVAKHFRPVFESLPFVNDPGYQKNLYFSIGQSAYTPDDLHRSDLIKDDRPYAGITYFSLGFIGKDTDKMDAIEVELGIVGPDSYASFLPDVVHDWLHETFEVKGWKNQLKDEPILNLFYGRNWRVLSSGSRDGSAYDIIPRIGVSVGNLLTAVNIGGEVRLGFNLPNDFGTRFIGQGSETNAPIEAKDGDSQKTNSFGVHLFFGLDVSAIARNLLLDGNTFLKSPSVKKKHFVERYYGGLGIRIHNTKITLINIRETKQFYLQKHPHKYSSLSISYPY
jgi:lipid A 3-O-deacylase